MTSCGSPSGGGAKLAVVTPSPLGQAIGEALAAAASLRGVPLVDLTRLASGPEDALVVCADAGGIEIPPGSRLAVVMVNPERAASWVTETQGHSESDGLLLASGLLASAQAVARRNGAPVFRHTDFRDDSKTALARLLGALDILPDGALLEEHARAIGDALQHEPCRTRAESIAERALAIYGAPTADGSPSAWWDRVLFRWGEHPEETCPAVIDVTGRSRPLVYGPWIALPEGLWRADLQFELCEEAERRSYLVEFGSEQGRSAVAMDSLQPGMNVVSVSHRFDATTPASIGLYLARAAFHGQMRYLGATITCLDAPEADADEADSTSSRVAERGMRVECPLP